MTRWILSGLALLACGNALAQSDDLAARSRGRATAPVTVYEMSDFQCPYCREFVLGTLPTLEREYFATGKARLVYINLPLTNIHPNAVAAAEAAMCAARQHKFWPMHDLLFHHQDQWAKLTAPTPYFLTLGDSTGLDRASFRRCVLSHATRAVVEADAQRARQSGAQSTPTFYVEGGLLEGAAPPEVFRAVLDSVYRSKTATPATAPR